MSHVSNPHPSNQANYNNSNQSKHLSNQVLVVAYLQVKKSDNENVLLNKKNDITFFCSKQL
jgi:hypothetical protein